MTYRRFLMAAGAAVLFAGSANAQPTPAPAPQADPSASSAGYNARAAAVTQPPAAAGADIVPGAVVKDSAGVEVGRVTRVQTGAGGAPLSVLVQIGRTQVTLPASSLTAQGQDLVVSQTKAELGSQARASSSSTSPSAASPSSGLEAPPIGPPS